VLFGGDDDEGAGGGEGAAPTAGAGGVEVVDAQDLGPLRLVTLRGDDAAIVATWLADHGFAAPAGLEAIAQDYLDDDWLLVAVRLRGAGGAEVRRLQPLIISFDSPRLVYPLRMSALADGPVEARVDAVAPEPLAVRGWPSRDLEPGGSGSGRLFAGPESNGRYLTSYRFAIEGDDFAEPEFVGARRSDFRQTIYEDEEVDITGRVLGIGFGALAVVALLGVAVVRRRRRT
jgi:hypothetical protein